MRVLTRWAILLAVGAMILIQAARNFGGEVAVLLSSDDYGRTYRTHVWVIGTDSSLWIRATDPTSPWLDRIINNPEVKLERGDEIQKYVATPSARSRDRVNAFMAEQYGWAEWLLTRVEDRSMAVPVHLDPYS